eukprot:1019277-Amphidinium_carterae.3
MGAPPSKLTVTITLPNEARPSSSKNWRKNNSRAAVGSCETAARANLSKYHARSGSPLRYWLSCARREATSTSMSRNSRRSPCQKG